MEELRKLEQVQRMLDFVESRGVVSSSTNSDHHSNRFLANLILFLIQPCGNLDMDEKCGLVCEFMPKLSASFLEEASLCLSQDVVIKQENSGCQQNLVGNSLQLSCDQMKYNNLLETNDENLAKVGLDSMQDANSTLEDFCRSYFMFHGLDVNRPQSIFKYLPVLSFTESYIYQLDRMNENLLQTPTNGESVLGGKNEKETPMLISCFPNDPFGPIVTLLKHKGLLTDRIREELRQGEEYWALERKLCHALIDKEEILVEDVMKAIHLKSFDYRVMNLLLYKLREEKVEELHMEFLSVSEFLVEIADDLYDYEDDVLENNFNILRMFSSIYGASTAPAMLAKCISEAEDKYDSLLKSLDPQLSMSYQKRCEEATKEGGMLSGNSRGGTRIGEISRIGEIRSLEGKGREGI
ncbi:EPIDERMAL PATTERNING FACTOR-like protein 1 isoform F [Senna tora]|uniref:EPIDERMAL PATTERNING FACTOR-like protein 1 isoform F n=1 Tax=Senna tora TaxID=362788 RepID=A0A834X7T5_9FABA|nr:EPIDERMAL PATTERNING FACTOR-like protein 1 isoform F [Senna tora]